MPKIKAVVFDLDDTLYDSTSQLVKEARKRVAREFVRAKLPLSPEQAYNVQLEIIKKYGENIDVFEKVLEKYNVKNRKKVKERVLRAYNSDDVSAIKLYSDVIPLLQELKKRKIKTAIVTSGLFNRQKKKISILGLNGFVDQVIIHDIERDSSKMNSMRKALKKLNLSPEQILSVGDKVFSEIKISNDLGMHTVQFLHRRYKKVKPKTAMEEPDYKIKKLSELTEKIDLIEKARNAFPKIVLIGGGSGTSIILKGLKKHTPNLTAIVTVTDTGRTTGEIRKHLGVIGTGDIRNCLIALSEEEGVLKNLFNYRFEEGKWKGYSFGNFFLAALAKQTGSFQKALFEASKILAIKGKVFPATLDKTHICVELENGKIIEQEDKIISRNEDISSRSPIKKAFLKPSNINPLPEAIKEIREADAIIIGPGGLFTSIIPNLLIKKIASEINKSTAKKIFICNIMTQQGQTDKYTASMHVKKILEQVGKNSLDYALINVEKPEKKFLSLYEKENAFLVEIDKQELNSLSVKPVFVKTLQTETEKIGEPNRREYLRHDPQKIAKELFKIIY